MAEVIEDAEEDDVVEAAFDEPGQLVDRGLDVLGARVEKPGEPVEAEPGGRIDVERDDPFGASALGYEGGTAVRGSNVEDSPTRKVARDTRGIHQPLDVVDTRRVDAVLQLEALMPDEISRCD
jgi:hypothetical protein